MPNAVPDEQQVARFSGDLEKLLAHHGLLLSRCRLGIALSGGPDSIALLLLAAASSPGWVRALTVDHGLRPEAADEAAYAARIAGTIGVPHDIAGTMVRSTGEGVQAAARDARYKALAEWAGREGIDAVLTGHHADDQAETLLMRMARGSGLAGLSGIRPVRHLAGADGPLLVRPLLGWRKAELEVIVAAVGIAPIHDPSNESARFDRTAARRLLAEAPWLDPVRMAQSAANLRDADGAIEWFAAAHFADAVREETGEIILSAVFPQEIRRRFLLRLFADRFGKKPDGPAVERAIAALDRGETVTLADILCRSDRKEWRFRHAPPRRRSDRSI